MMVNIKILILNKRNCHLNNQVKFTNNEPLINIIPS